MIGFLRRRYLSIFAFVLAALACAGLYLLITPPSFTASATMMIDARRSQALQSIYPDAPSDAAWIESQIGILKSENVALNVVKQLRLTEDLAFTGSASGWFDQLAAFVSGNLPREVPWLFDQGASASKEAQRSPKFKSEEAATQAVLLRLSRDLCDVSVRATLSE